MKTEDVYGMTAVVTSRGAADTAIALTKVNPKATWEAILRRDARKALLDSVAERRATRSRKLCDCQALDR